MTHWQVTRLNKSLDEHATAWNALNQRLFNGHPMLSASFVEGLLKHFGYGSEHLCVRATDGVPDGMCQLKPAHFGVWSTFLPSQAQISPVLIQKLVSVTELINSLPGFVVRLDFLCNDPQFGELDTGDYATSNRMDHALTMTVKLQDGFQAYWESRSKTLTKNIARYEQRLVVTEKRAGAVPGLPAKHHRRGERQVSEHQPVINPAGQIRFKAASSRLGHEI